MIILTLFSLKKKIYVHISNPNLDIFTHSSILKYVYLPTVNRTIYLYIHRDHFDTAHFLRPFLKENFLSFAIIQMCLHSSYAF